MSNLLQHPVKQRCTEDWLLSRICHSWFFQLRMFLLCWALNLSARKDCGEGRQMSEGVKSMYINSMALSLKAEALVGCTSCKRSWDPSIWLQASLQTDLSPSTSANSSWLCVNGTTNSAFCPQSSWNHGRRGRGRACHALLPAWEGNPCPRSSGRIFNFDIRFPSRSKDTAVCPHVCPELEYISELSWLLKDRCIH